MANSTLAFSILATATRVSADSADTEENHQQNSSNKNTQDNSNRPHHTVMQAAGTYSLDGYANNKKDPKQGASGDLYGRIAPANYDDGIGAIADGPQLRFISNRVFADGSQNLFSENSVTQWAFNWGQFLDHTIGLRESGSEPIEVSFNSSDQLEYFSNSGENITVTRSASSANTGVSTTREHVNTVSSYIDAWAVYGGTEERLEWLRAGPLDGDLSNNSAKLLLSADGYLPTASARGNAAAAPVMERVGMLRALPNADDIVVIAGDQRANENIALTAAQTLFAREHNRIVDQLPLAWSEQRRFDTARQMVIATQQYITYNEFLPAVGLLIDPATQYKPSINASISHEFATVGYRAHSMIHGEIELEVKADRYDSSQLDSFKAQGIEVEQTGDEVEIAVPLNIAFANPQLVTSLGLGPIAAGLGGEPQYKNDETIDNQLRSVLFQIPNPDIANPDACLDGPNLPQCYLLVSDVGLLDVFRARDHGIPDYNALRIAYGLPPVQTFVELTAELSEEFSTDDPEIDLTDPINDPSIMDYIELRNLDGELLTIGSDEADAEAVVGIRRSNLAARLKAIYGTVDQLDAFVGMVSEPHLIGSEFGELQHAMWKVQFEALRDGDANFYLWNRQLSKVLEQVKPLGLTYRQTLADIIVNNTDVEVDEIQANMFLDKYQWVKRGGIFAASYIEWIGSYFLHT